MDKKTDRQENRELDVDLSTGEIIPENEKKTYKTPKVTSAGTLKNVSRVLSSEGPSTD